MEQGLLTSHVSALAKEEMGEHVETGTGGPEEQFL